MQMQILSIFRSNGSLNYPSHPNPLRRWKCTEHYYLDILCKNVHSAESPFDATELIFTTDTTLYKLNLMTDTTLYNLCNSHRTTPKWNTLKCFESDHYSDLFRSGKHHDNKSLVQSEFHAAGLHSARKWIPQTHDTDKISSSSIVKIIINSAACKTHVPLLFVNLIYPKNFHKISYLIWHAWSLLVSGRSYSKALNISA